MRTRLGAFLRTTWGRVVLLLVAIAVVWIVTVTIAEAVFDAYPSQGEALWFGLAHLLDPGTLGEDETAAQRGIGVVQVLAGLVLLVGVVLAVASEVVGRGLERLFRDDPPLSLDGHILVVGHPHDAQEVLRAIAGHAPGSTVALLAPQELRGHLDPLRASLRGAAPRARLEVTTGDASTAAGLERACASSARTITVLSPPEPDDVAADVAVLEIGAVLAELLERTGRTGTPVALDVRRGLSAEAAADQPAGFDAVVRDRALGGVITLAVSTPGFAAALASGAAGAGRAAIRVTPAGEVAGRTFGELAGLMNRCVPMGLLSPAAGGGYVPEYMPAPDRPLAEGARAIVLAGSMTAPLHRPDAPAASPAPPVGSLAEVGGGRLRVLVVGWSAACGGLEYLLGLAPSAAVDATVLLAREAPVAPPFTVRVGDISDPGVLAAALEDTRPDIVLVASADGGGAAADARAVVTALHLARAGAASGPPILLEQQVGRPSAVLHAGGGRVHVLSAPAIAVQRNALAAADPAALLAQESLVDERVRLDDRRYDPPDGRPTTLGALAAALAPEHAAPFVVTRGGESVEADDMAGLEVRPDDRILVLRWADSTPAPTGDPAER